MRNTTGSSTLKAVHSLLVTMSGTIRVHSSERAFSSLANQRRHVSFYLSRNTTDGNSPRQEKSEIERALSTVKSKASTNRSDWLEAALRAFGVWKGTFESCEIVLFLLSKPLSKESCSRGITARVCGFGVCLHCCD